MQGPDTLYFFFDEQNRSVYKDGNNLMYSPTPVPLKYTPSGWEDIIIQIVRNQKYFALDRMLTVPLEFVEDGAFILKYYFATKGLEGKLRLVIAKQQLYFDDTHYGFYYTRMFDGDVDWSKYLHDGPKVTVNILEGGIPKMIKANEAVKYEIPIDAPDTIKVKMDGMKFHAKATYVNSGIELTGESAVFHSLPISFISKEGDSINIVNQNQQIQTANISFIEALAPTSIELKGEVKFKANNFVGIYRLFMDIRRADGSIVARIRDEVYNNPTPGQEYTITINDICNLQADENIIIIGTVFPTSAGNRDRCKVTYSETNIIASYDTRFKTTYIKARRPKGVATDLASKVCKTPTLVESNCLETYKTIVVTSGDALRGLSGAVIKTSLSDYFQSYNTMLSIGMGVVKGKLKIERKVDWVDYTNPINLGEGKKLKVSPSLDYLCTSLKIGYPEQEYDGANGRGEFNNTHVYTTPMTVGKVLELISVYRSDPYGSEYTRINFEGKTTTDNSADNDVFVLHIKEMPIIDPEEGEVYELDRSLNQYATGLLEQESAFNLYLTPKECLFRNGPYIRSCFYKLDDQYLVFETTEKNANVSVAPPGGRVITEKANVEIADLGDRLFIPIQLDIEAIVPVNQDELLSDNPVRSFSINYEGVLLTGIPTKVSSQPVGNESQAYLFLAAPTTDLLPLIEIYE